MAWWDSVVDWGADALGDVKWGDYLPGIAQTGLEIWQGMGQQDRADAASAEQMAFAREKFAADEAYRYAELAKSGGGGGPDPRTLAMQRQQANDAFFAKQREMSQAANQNVSESLRGIASSYARAYGR